MDESTQTLVGPQLLVDWGDLPRVGRQVRPEFSLICPGYPSRPEIQVLIDRELDHEDDQWRPQPQQQEPGLWSFHSRFRMTSGGVDCRPGQYLIDVHVSFRDVPPQLPRFYRARIRLNVPDQQSGEASVLEINGDGHQTHAQRLCHQHRCAETVSGMRVPCLTGIDRFSPRRTPIRLGSKPGIAHARKPPTNQPAAAAESVGDEMNLKLAANLSKRGVIRSFRR